MGTMYVLDIVDNEDGFLYIRLLFDDINEIYRCKHVVDTFESRWYNDECSEYEMNIGYYESLLEILRKEKLIKCDLMSYTIGVR